LSLENKAFFLARVQQKAGKYIAKMLEQLASNKKKRSLLNSH
jgi:hypothetical protein